MENAKKNKFSKKRVFDLIKGFAVYGLVGLAALIFFVNLSGGVKLGDEVPISQIVQDTKDHKIDSLSLENDTVTAKYKDSDKTVQSRKEANQSIYQILKNADVDPKSVNITVKDTSIQQAWLSIIGTVLPILLMVGLIYFLIVKQAREA